eukprot:COSAG04_NODE_1094_length_8313_cov_18.592160_14_plen_117_part_00
MPSVLPVAGGLSACLPARQPSLDAARWLLGRTDVSLGQLFLTTNAEPPSRPATRQARPLPWLTRGRCCLDAGVQYDAFDHIGAPRYPAGGPGITVKDDSARVFHHPLTCTHPVRNS